VVAAEVAALIAQLDTVAEAAVVGRPDPEWGQRVTAVVVPADPETPPTLEQLRDWVGAHLPRYAAPRELDLRAELPLLPSGKPDLRRLSRA
jgi:O-succinylbenzoic acid--CoA ligase